MIMRDVTPVAATIYAVFTHAENLIMSQKLRRCDVNGCSCRHSNNDAPSPSPTRLVDVRNIFERNKDTYLCINIYETCMRVGISGFCNLDSFEFSANDHWRLATPVKRLLWFRL